MQLQNSLFMQFIRNPRMTGAVCPSSQKLCKALTNAIGLETASAIAELGPGTGAVTAQILKRKSPDAAFMAVELNKSVIEPLKKKFPGITLFHDSAANLPALVQQNRLTALDVIISGLPWAIFPEHVQDELLTAISASLAPGGRFVTFAYLQGVILPAGLKFRKKLACYFPEIKRSPVIWQNIPPAFVYRCIKKEG